jgi:HAD superfamily hydrolase (TIGR01509 family)
MDAAIRAVFWDLGGVILRTQDSAPRRAWEARLGLAPDELARLVFNGPASREAMLGRGSGDEVWESVGASLGLKSDERDRLRADFFAGDRIDEDLMGFIRGLRPRLHVGLISNAWPEVRRLLESTWRIAAAFDPLILSPEVGLVKPDPAIFRQALVRAGVLPAHSAFVDDFQENVDAANALGMRGVLFRTSAQAREDVTRLVGRG